MAGLTTEESARLIAAALKIPVPDRRDDSFDTATLTNDPQAVFSASMVRLARNARSAETWSDADRTQFESELSLLVAGLRAATHTSDSTVKSCCEECKNLLALCQQPDPEGPPHLDCFMAYAACLFQCSSAPGNHKYH